MNEYNIETASGIFGIFEARADTLLFRPIKQNHIINIMLTSAREGKTNNTFQLKSANVWT